MFSKPTNSKTKNGGSKHVFTHPDELFEKHDFKIDSFKKNLRNLLWVQTKNSKMARRMQNNFIKKNQLNLWNYHVQNYTRLKNYQDLYIPLIEKSKKNKNYKTKSAKEYFYCICNMYYFLMADRRFMSHFFEILSFFKYLEPIYPFLLSLFGIIRFISKCLKCKKKKCKYKLLFIFLFF